MASVFCRSEFLQELMKENNLDEVDLSSAIDEVHLYVRERRMKPAFALHRAAKKAGISTSVLAQTYAHIKKFSYSDKGRHYKNFGKKRKQPTKGDNVQQDLPIEAQHDNVG